MAVAGGSGRAKAPRRNPQEAGNNDPRQAYGLIPIDGLVPPLPNGAMVRDVLVDRVKQDIEVNNPHLRSASLRVVSSSSSAAARLSALSTLNEASPMA
jgi:hypothetical protein